MPLTPALIKNLGTKSQSVSPLQRVPRDTPPYDEDWLQDLIDKHPGLVPAGEVEASFEDIIPVARELPLPSGNLDNLYITPDGYPVLVEVKLWKNQEARRKVVAQILEYAKDFAGLNYEALNSKIRKVRAKESWGENPLFEIVSHNVPGPQDETVFVDRVSRNLREGRFLLLILGDGVREGMECLSNYLMHHSLRYAFGIIRIRFFGMPDGTLLALPDVLAKTQTIERHVTVVTTQDVNVTVSGLTETSGRASISLDKFYECMGKTSLESVLWLKGFIRSLADLPIEPLVGLNGNTLLLKAALQSGDTPTLMYISPPFVDFWGAFTGRLKKTPDGQTIIRTFLDRIANLVPGATVKVYEKSMDVRLNGGRVPVLALHGADEKLKDVMREFIQSANVLEDSP